MTLSSNVLNEAQGYSCADHGALLAVPILVMGGVLVEDLSERKGRKRSLRQGGEDCFASLAITKGWGFGMTPATAMRLPRRSLL